MAGIMTVEQLQIEGEKLLGKIRVSPREFVEFQLETEFGFEDLQVLMKTLQCEKQIRQGGSLVAGKRI